MTTPIQTDLQVKALEQLKKDAQKIEQLIALQLSNLTLPKCPLYEEVLDTQMFGLSREIDFAARLGLIEQREGKELLHQLERKLAELYSAILP